MKQVIQNFSNGQLSVDSVPAPQLNRGGVLVRTAFSLISAGTEKATVDVAKKNLIDKARARPDLVRKVIDKAQKDGILNTVNMVRSRLQASKPLGYSCAGEVIGVAPDVAGVRMGDRIACAGAGYANHSEVNFVPVNLIAKIPKGVSDADASYTTVASIALQGVRLANLQLGSYVAVVGLGLVGQLAVQLLKASGCRVIGMDIDPFMVEKALASGADVAINNKVEDTQSAVDHFTCGFGVDATLITAATSSNEPIRLAGEITREKGRVVVVGAVGLDVPREPYYMKEIDLVVSRSYGPGRYDPAYEEGGIDYPYAYVRFTEQRNMETVLSLMDQQKIKMDILTTHRFPFLDAAEAYALIQKKENREPYLGILLEYTHAVDLNESFVFLKNKKPTGTIGLGAIGAGNYATANLFPTLQKSADVYFRRICTASGASARAMGERLGFAEAVSKPEQVLEDEQTNLILIATRHDAHATHVIGALEAGKHVFVEKPLCLSQDELHEIDQAYQKSSEGSITVGFNRRFASLTQTLKTHFDGIVGHKTLQIRVNAGTLPQDHWLNDPIQGGGRLIGEGCHFIDLMIYLVNKRPISVFASGSGMDSPQLEQDFAITLQFEDGSIGNLLYTQLGDAQFPKERIEMYGGGSVGMIDDFRSGLLVVGGKKKKLKASGQDKGQVTMLQRLVESLARGGASPIPYEQIRWTMQTCFAAVASLASKRVVELPTGSKGK